MIRRRFVSIAAALLVAGVAGLKLPAIAHAQPVIDEQARAALLKQRDGRLARLKTKYNDIIVVKRRHELMMYFRAKDGDSLQSVANLRDPDALPLALTRTITTAVAYPNAHKRILMIGLGGGSVTTYLARAMPELAIDAVDIDPGVIEIAKKYFAIRETPRIRLIASDGRAFLQDSTQSYDMIFHDAYHGDGVPSQLLTREFYEVMRNRLAPGGAAVYNLHTGTPNYLPTLKTLSTVFPALHLYPSGEGEMIAIATVPELDRKTLEGRAAELQQRYMFRYPLPHLLKKRVAMPSVARARVLTDATTVSRWRSEKR
jgi:spermidine synthase